MSKWTDEEILEGEKLIANFMNIEVQTFGYKDSKWLIVGSEDDLMDITNHISYLPHNDFDCLMPVLQKLSNIGCIVQCVFNLGYTCSIWYPKGKYKGSINIIEGTNGNDSPELATFKCIVQFLKEYNESKEVKRNII